MIAKSCLVCGAPNTKSCSVCKSAYYCSEEHQKQDWESHKGYCHKVKAAGANTIDAILFPVNESQPRLVKVPWKLIRVHPDDDDMVQNPDVDVWFKHANRAVLPLFFDRWGINGPELGRGLFLLYDDNFMMNGLPLNRCIVDVTGGNAGHRWCGNVLGLRRRDYSLDFFEDVVVEEDLKPFVRYFDEYNKVKPVY